MTEARRILVVDDSPEDRESYRRLLHDGEHSYESHETDTGEEGLQICLDQEPDCVLLDYNLPDIDGLEFLSELSNVGYTDRPAVVMFTGSGNESIAVEAMKSGAQDYLVKGKFSSPDFHRAIDNAIHKMKLIRAVEHHREELARSNADLQQFASAAAHDLQAPLRRIKTFTELLEERYEGKFDEDADEFIGFIIKSVEHMQELIDGLLVFSRVSASERPNEPVKLSDALHRVLANLAEPIEQSGAQITFDELPTVQADQIQMIQLLQNLVSNAIKYHEDGVPEIQIYAQQTENEVAVSVRDNGIGIDSKDFEKVFQIFKRLHGEDKYPGTGIGLATCKRIVERHGGRIWLESTPGEGSVFSFTIPNEVNG